MSNTPTDGNDVLTGTVNVDFISGLGGNDSVFGDSGNDWLWGDAGDDVLNGGAGNDNLTGGLGNDTFLVSGAFDGYDSYFGTDGDISTSDVIRATSADTFIGIRNLSSNSGIDRIDSGGFVNVYIQLSSGGGVVSVLDLTGVTTVGITAIRGDGGDNSATGSSSADRFEGQGGIDVFFGGLGNDVMVFGGVNNGRATFYGDGGNDSIIAISNNAVIGLNALQSVETISSQAFTNVTITGDANANVLDFSGTILTGIVSIDAGGGNDTLVSSAGGDALRGGADIDTISYFGSNAAVNVNLNGATASGGYAQGDTIAGFENLTGSDFADTLAGNTGGNTIIGGLGADSINAWIGNDSVIGGVGNDSLIGERGNDTLEGGQGVDRFYFNTALDPATNIDIVNDFNVTDDFLMLSSLVFTGLGAKGFLATSSFAAVTVGGNATIASHRIVYEQASGKVFYDADGSGATMKVHFATISANTALSAADLYNY
jgi:serralysin